MPRYSLVSGGRATRSACGRTTRRSVVVARQPERRRRFPLPARQRADRGAHDLGDEGRGVQRDADEEGDELGRHGDAALAPRSRRRRAGSATSCRSRRGRARPDRYRGCRRAADRPGRRSRGRWQAEDQAVPEEHVQQHRHVAHHFDVAGAERARERVARQSAEADHAGRPGSPRTIAAAVSFRLLSAPATKAFA